MRKAEIFTFIVNCAIIRTVMRPRRKDILLLIALPMGLPPFIIFRDLIEVWTQSFPVCFILDRYHIICPACGITRSVLFLLQGDVISSLRYHILPVLLLIIGLGFYVEAWMSVCGKKVTVIPRKISLLVVVVIGFVIYVVLRNVIPSFM